VASRLDGKVALVTGASKGIGAATALYLAEQGAAVGVNYSASRAWAERLVQQISERGGRAVALGANLASLDQIPKLFEAAEKQLGRLDILVNNAGIYQFMDLEAITLEHYQKHFDLNVRGLLFAIQASLRHFNPSGGSIINVSSIAATSRSPGAAVYCATKAAVDAFTRCLSTELGPRKIRVNSVNPGLVVTEGTRAAGMVDEELRRAEEEKTPLGRIGQPRDIAQLIGFLASDEASWITGETHYISGGFR
jgi:3-oxoacyl-[acyl-carrier protein] reductase